MTQLAGVSTGKPEKRKKKRPLWIILIILGAAVALLIAVVTLMPKDPYQQSMEGVRGMLDSRTPEEIQAELARIMKENEMHVSINTTPHVVDGIGKVRIENVPNNKYWQQVDIYLTNEDDSPGERLYRSGLVRQDFHIEDAEFENVPAPGRYNGIAVVKAIHPETSEEIGQTKVLMVITVEE